MCDQPRTFVLWTFWSRSLLVQFIFRVPKENESSFHGVGDQEVTTDHIPLKEFETILFTIKF